MNASSAQRPSFRRRDGNTITYAYDALNREISRAYTNTLSLPVYTTYDLLGRTLSRTYSAASGPGVIWTWDKAGRETSEATGGLQVSLTYDADGDRASFTWPDGAALRYTFDAADRFSEVADTGGAASVTVGYDPLGRMTSLTRPTGHVTSFAYDSADRLTSLTQAFEGGAGNIAWTYAYTPASQVASSGASTSQFDWTGSPPSTINKAYDGLNRDATITALPGGYDANQNLTFDGTRTFAYDGDNRLVTESAAGTSTTLAYDPTGRLETQATTTGGATTTTTYLYDGDNLAAEYDGSGNLLRRYAHGPGVDNPLIWYEGAVSAVDARYLVADRQGSVIGYADGGGTISAPGDVYTYDEYGAPGGWGGARFRYTGQIEIPELQLYDYKARMYDPITGRFLQTDPVGYKDDVDLYAYVGEDPLNHTDPTGNTISCDDNSCTLTNPSIADFIAYGVIYAQRVIQNALTPPAPVHSEPAKPTAPPVPDKPVGENPQPGRTGGRTVSGPLAPEHGGTGDAGQDFGHLTGGTGKPNTEQGRPPGTQVGDNGVQLRPGPKGPRIDIPGNGPKAPETLHYPPPPPPPPKLPNE